MDSSEVLMVLRPHPLSLIHSYVAWSYVAFVPLLASLLGGVGVVNSSPALAIAFVAIPLLGASLITRSVSYGVAGAIGGLVLPWILGHVGAYALLPPTQTSVGVLGVALSELYRRMHRYVIARDRIVIEFRGVLGRVVRVLHYSKIVDVVVLRRGIAGFFGIGVLLPLTSLKEVSRGSYPWPSPLDAIYGVSRPERVAQVIKEAVRSCGCPRIH